MKLVKVVLGLGVGLLAVSCNSSSNGSKAEKARSSEFEGTLQFAVPPVELPASVKQEDKDSVVAEVVVSSAKFVRAETFQYVAGGLKELHAVPPGEYLVSVTLKAKDDVPLYQGEATLPVAAGEIAVAQIT